MEAIGTNIYDKKVKAYNQMYECTLKEFYNLTCDILRNNDYQRTRVKSSSSIYSLLKDDLIQGCMIPPIVMAYTGNNIDMPIDLMSHEVREKLLILDGLQRSYTIWEIMQEVDSFKDKSFLDSTIIRIELYTKINRMGILYRMLTLNTGQTRMSTRHQIEIIYSDYIQNSPIENIQLIKETDKIQVKEIGQYKFRDVIEGFTSFLECDYLTLDRQDLLDQVKTLTSLGKKDQNIELFSDFLKTYNDFIIHINSLRPNDIHTDLTYQFGNNLINIFNKSQALTGFGAAMGIMQNREIINNFAEIREYISKIDADYIDDGCSILLSNLDTIRKKAKKIGNDQRLYFHYFFRKFFDKERDAFLNFEKSAIEEYKEYQRDVF